MANEGEKGKEPEKETRHAVHDYEECTDQVCSMMLLKSERLGLNIQTGRKGYLYSRCTKRSFGVGNE